MHGKEDVEIENALQPLKEKQHAQYIQVVQDAIKAEEKRKNKLQKVTSNLEAKRLEKNFIKERQFDKEKLIQLQQDHVLLIHAKRQELLAMKEKGIKPTLEEKITGRKSIVNKMATSQNKEKHSEPVKFTKQSLERLMQPCNKFTTNVTTGAV
jgi:predicted RND superfamily exporter protein